MKKIYMSPEQALETITERKSNPEIRVRVARYLGDVLPDPCFEELAAPALLMRYVPRGTGEDRIFAETASLAGFTPVWASYVADRFTTRNPEKVETIRPPIRWAKGQRTRSWVVEPEERQGGVGELTTIYGNNSADYQKELRNIVFENDGCSDLIGNSFDMGSWYALQAKRFGYESGSLARYYYPASLALATTFYAMYEDFDGGPNAGNGDLAQFRQEVLYLAIEKVKNDLDLSPVIVQMPYQPGMNETDLSFLDKEDAENLKRYGTISPKETE